MSWRSRFTFLFFTLSSFSLFAIDASNRYRSPRNPERKIRQATTLIVLHTTEAPAKSSLNKVSDRGECHFVVTEEGEVYRIVDRDKEAFHAGRSMWNGKEDCDKFSIGIECVGYHDKPMGSIQLDAIKRLVKELQTMYRIPDENVVAHSHVAYGAPNMWQMKNHRGRKRCGMLFAMPSVRKYLGLKARPAYDADTRAKRLTVGDDYLNRVLYGNIDTMRGKIATAPEKRAESGGLFSWFGFKKAEAPAQVPEQNFAGAEAKTAITAITAKTAKTAITAKTAKTAKTAITTKTAITAITAKTAKTENLLLRF